MAAYLIERMTSARSAVAVVQEVSTAVSAIGGHAGLELFSRRSPVIRSIASRSMGAAHGAWSPSGKPVVFLHGGPGGVGTGRSLPAELVLRGIFTLRSSEVDWYYRGGAANLFPDLWEKFMAPVSGTDGDPVERYAKLLADPDPAVHGPAAVAWSSWERRTHLRRARHPQGAAGSDGSVPWTVTEFLRRRR